MALSSGFDVSPLDFATGRADPAGFGTNNSIWNQGGKPWGDRVSGAMQDLNGQLIAKDTREALTEAPSPDGQESASSYYTRMADVMRSIDPLAAQKYADEAAKAHDQEAARATTGVNTALNNSKEKVWEEKLQGVKDDPTYQQAKAAIAAVNLAFLMGLPEKWDETTSPMIAKLAGHAAMDAGYSTRKKAAFESTMLGVTKDNYADKLRALNALDPTYAKTSGLTGNWEEDQGIVGNLAKPVSTVGSARMTALGIKSIGAALQKVLAAAPADKEAVLQQQRQNLKSGFNLSDAQLNANNMPEHYTDDNTLGIAAYGTQAKAKREQMEESKFDSQIDDYKKDVSPEMRSTYRDIAAKSYTGAKDYRDGLDAASKIGSIIRSDTNNGKISSTGLKAMTETFGFIRMLNPAVVRQGEVDTYNGALGQFQSLTAKLQAALNTPTQAGAEALPDIEVEQMMAEAQKFYDIALGNYNREMNYYNSEWNSLNTEGGKVPKDLKPLPSMSLPPRPMAVPEGWKPGDPYPEFKMNTSQSTGNPGKKTTHGVE